ncbi:MULTISPECIES: TetR/AcrR family transcriptional regulator [Novosphingobium]|uniref:TetR/AcrR family transcriptional regulator n=1 Tax=unclassified Novosphingobium TaxID=2644732 RepID=UPI000ABF2CF0|nr:MULTISPECIES: TetR family transcriptional regulator C-terminal domain-containing protein [unclassified Novosphingobium]TCM34362.1 TetR family transcriptional regulator [Novosphingobium sp. ST904]
MAQIDSDSVSRPGVYARGTETVDAILKAALSVLIEEGATAFTIRRVAAACGLRVGNVSYHFPRKEMLVQVLLDDIMAHYDAKLEVNVRQAEIPDEDRLRLVITMCLDDISTKRTTRLFTELWALANHNDFIAERIHAFYGKVHDVLSEHIRPLNPNLSEDEVRTLALFISASMEGTTPFLGFDKPWKARMPAITAISLEWFVHLVKNVKPGDIASLTSALT